jgi:hypothetical protein
MLLAQRPAPYFQNANEKRLGLCILLLVSVQKRQGVHRGHGQSIPSLRAIQDRQIVHGDQSVGMFLA